VSAVNSAGASEYSTSTSLTTSVAIAYKQIATLLYVGIANSYTDAIPYPEYSDVDLQKLINSSSALNSKEFVITGGDAAYGFTENVSQADINSIRMPRSIVYRNYLGATDAFALNVFVDGIN